MFYGFPFVFGGSQGAKVCGCQVNNYEHLYITKSVERSLWLPSNNDIWGEEEYLAEVISMFLVRSILLDFDERHARSPQTIKVVDFQCSILSLKNAHLTSFIYSKDRKI